jgi:hypothetical protein
MPARMVHVRASLRARQLADRSQADESKLRCWVTPLRSLAIERAMIIGPAFRVTVFDRAHEARSYELFNLQLQIKAPSFRGQ